MIEDISISIRSSSTIIDLNLKIILKTTYSVNSIKGLISNDWSKNNSCIPTHHEDKVCELGGNRCAWTCRIRIT